MKFNKIIHVLILFTLIFFLPLIRPSVEFTVFPFRQNEVIINIQGNKVHLESEGSNTPVRLNVSYLDFGSNNSHRIGSFVFIDTLDIDLNNWKRGNYLFEFITTTISTITIDERGLPNSTIFILGGLILIRIGSYIRKKNKLRIEY